MNQNLEKNKKNAIEFYKMSYDGDPRKAVELYVGTEYIQHGGANARGLFKNENRQKQVRVLTIPTSEIYYKSPGIGDAYLYQNQEWTKNH